MSKPSYDLKKVAKLPSGTLFVQLSFELINSPSWRSMSINCRRLIDYLMCEHMRHAGHENGNLFATYDQLEEFGMSRPTINKSISEAEFLGLITAERGKREGKNNKASLFTLTFFASKVITEDGVRLFEPPTNEWRKVKKEDIMCFKSKLK